MWTLRELLEFNAWARPRNVALVMGEREVTYGELWGLSWKVANALLNRGIRPGDRVALVLPNCVEYVALLYGLPSCGTICVPVNPLLKPGEMAYIFSHSESSAVVTIPPLEEVVCAAAEEVPSLKQVFVLGESAKGNVNLAPEIAQASTSPLPSAPREEDIALIIYTSGTTGRPKGAMLTHLNLVYDAEAAGRMTALSSEDVFLCVLPLFHSFGITVCAVLPFLYGAKVVLLPRFSPEETAVAIERHRVTFFPAVSTMFLALLRAKFSKEYDFSSLKYCIAGGAPCPLEVMEEWEKRFGVPIAEGDGPTECGPVTSVNPPLGRIKPGTVGPALPGVRMKIVDDNDFELPPGEVGEIVVKGPNVMLGYYKAPEETREALRYGWFHTGDLGKVDEDGYFSIVDRKKDLIIVGGLNVYPREVEEVLYRHPKVKEAAVVGMPDPLRGEAVKAYVVLKEGEEATEAEIISFCRQHLAPFKVPRRVEFLPELPKSATGKILRRELRERTASEG